MKTTTMIAVALGLLGGSCLAAASAPCDVRNVAMESVEWQTAHAGTLQLPVDYPAGAVRAVLTVTNLTAWTAATVTEVPLGATSVEWTAFTGTAPREDAVYDLRLAFYKSGAASPFTNCTARVALVKGAFGDSVNAFATSEARGWRHAQNPVAFHCDARWQDESAAANATTVMVAQAGLQLKEVLGGSGWFGTAFRFPPWGRGDNMSVTADFADCETQLSATIVFPLHGVVFVFR